MRRALAGVALAVLCTLVGCSHGSSAGDRASATRAAVEFATTHDQLTFHATASAIDGNCAAVRVSPVGRPLAYRGLFQIVVLTKGSTSSDPGRTFGKWTIVAGPTDSTLRHLNAKAPACGYAFARAYDLAMPNCTRRTLIPEYDRVAVTLEPGSRLVRCGNPARIVITGDPVAVTAAYAAQLGCRTVGESQPGSFTCRERLPLSFWLAGSAGAGDYRFKAFQGVKTNRWEAELSLSPG